jgi:hypothetical protein
MTSPVSASTSGDSSRTVRASSKSIRLGCPSRPTRMCRGWMSPWTMPVLWRARYVAMTPSLKIKSARHSTRWSQESDSSHGLGWGGLQHSPSLVCQR